MFVTRAAAIASLVALAVPTPGSGPPVATGSAAAPASEAAAQRHSPFAVGELFPDLAFPSLQDGTPTRLSDFRGHKVMLHIFASW